MSTDPESPGASQSEVTAEASAQNPEPGAPAAAKSSAPRLDRDGRERPAFVLSFPSDPQLDALVRAFEGGNFALVREEAPKLAASTTDPVVRDAALELRRRIDPDPSVVRLLLLAFALLAFVAIWAYAKQH